MENFRNMPMTINCIIEGCKRPDNNTCTNCKQRVCNQHFNETNKICINCAKKRAKKI